MTSSPRVSVLMPVLNPHPIFFRLAVESVLRQSLADCELIIIEDPSSRSGRQFLAGLNDSRIRHILNPTRTSLVDQRNQGLDEARSEYVACLDADDVSEQDRLQKQVDCLRAHPDLGVLGTQLRIIDERGEHRGFRRYPESHDAILKALPRFNPIAQPAVMFRRSVVLDAGRYQYRNYPAEDYELWCRLAARGVRFANHPEPLVRYRIHPEGGKSARLRGIIRGGLEVKQMYWRGRMDFGARARLWIERLLLWLPPRLVLELFVKTHYDSTL